MTQSDRELDRARWMVRVLDDYFVDPLLGFALPGVGDVIGSVLGLYLVVIAARRHLSPLVIARMVMNLGADALLGVVPIVGDAFDFGFKANRRNLALLTDRASTGGRATAADWLVLLGALAAFAAVVGLVCWGVVALVHAL